MRTKQKRTDSLVGREAKEDRKLEGKKKSREHDQIEETHGDSEASEEQPSDRDAAEKHESPVLSKVDRNGKQESKDSEGDTSAATDSDSEANQDQTSTQPPRAAKESSKIGNAKAPPHNNNVKASKDQQEENSDEEVEFDDEGNEIDSESGAPKMGMGANQGHKRKALEHAKKGQREPKKMKSKGNGQAVAAK